MEIKTIPDELLNKHLSEYFDINLWDLQKKQTFDGYDSISFLITATKKSSNKIPLQEKYYYKFYTDRICSSNVLQQIDLSKILTKKNINSKKIVYFNKQEMFSIEIFLEGVLLDTPEMRSVEFLPSAMHAIEQFHQIDPSNFPNLQNFLIENIYSEDLILECKKNLLKKTKTAQNEEMIDTLLAGLDKSEVDFIKSYIPTSKSVFCHNDTCSGNIIHNPIKKETYLIDWDDIAINFRGFDIYCYSLDRYFIYEISGMDLFSIRQDLKNECDIDIILGVYLAWWKEPVSSEIIFSDFDKLILSKENYGERDKRSWTERKNTFTMINFKDQLKKDSQFEIVGPKVTAFVEEVIKKYPNEFDQLKIEYYFAGLIRNYSLFLWALTMLFTEKIEMDFLMYAYTVFLDYKNCKKSYF